MEASLWIKKLVQVQLPEISDSKLKPLETAPELEQFLNDMNTTSLFIALNKKSGNMTFSYELLRVDDSVEVLLLNKIKPAIINGENFGKLVRFVPLSNSPINELYQIIHCVYGPMLQKRNLGATSKVQGLLIDLENDLAATLWNKNSESEGLNLACINSFGDEILYWTHAATESKTNSESNSKRAAFFKDTFLALKSDFDRISSLSFDEIFELIEKIHDALDQVWRQQDHLEYPQERMQHLMTIITEDILNATMHNLSKYDVIKDSISNVLEPLKNSKQICQSLISTFDTLTAVIWPNISVNKWTGHVFLSRPLQIFSNRLKSILNLRTSHELLVNLLDATEQKELAVDDAFKHFDHVNPLGSSSLSESRWKSALESYHDNITSLELLAASKIQAILSELLSQPSQLQREFQKYKDVIQRKNIAQKLENEKEVLLGQLTASLKKIEAEYNNKLEHLSAVEGGDFVANISWARQILGKLGETDSIVNALIGSKSVYQNASKIIQSDISKFENDQFESWVQENQRLVDDGNGELILEKTGRLMELDFTTGKLNVNYGDKLVTLLRETRLLVSMGFSVPSFIQKLSEIGHKFYRHGVVLKQVANFYNTIDQQMLPFQQPMMLNLALEFEKIVKSPAEKNGSITWNNPQELESYVARLQNAAERLTSENTKLRKCHFVILEFIKTLMVTDLINQQAKWKEIMSSILSIISTIQDTGIKQENMATWLNHLDYQLYKALEYQYQLGLESHSSTLPNINVELVYKQQKIQFRPSFEEIKAKYFREMKRFINLPSSFKPLGNSTIFSNMVASNSKSLLTVYKKADMLFQNLFKVQDNFLEWVALGSVDLDAFVEIALIDPEDWELNFRMVKQKGKESELLPSTIQIDCITISTVPIKATIDDLLQRVFDSLLNALKKAANVHLSAIQQFTKMALEMLATKPQSMAEIGNANTVHGEISKNRSKITNHFEAAEKYNKLLKSVAGFGIDTSQVKSQWSKLEIILESHELMVKEQVDVLRGAIDSRIVTFLQEVEKFGARWNQLKPKPAELAKFDSNFDPVKFITGKEAEFLEIQKGEILIKEDCGHFGIEPPVFSQVQDLKIDIENTLKIWSFQQEFSKGLKEFSDQDWITFRTKAQSFEDFLNTWNEKARSGTVDVIKTSILKQVDSFKSMAPSLKYLRGDSWMSEHWGELFRILSFPKGVNLSEMTFGDFLKAKDEIVKNISSIVELNTRASGEISIREAIQELEIWGASACFSFTDYQDGNGVKLKLIKDWKETLTQVGDNLSLLQSLKDSPYFKNFAEKAMIWEKKLADSDEFLRSLNNIQRKWVYLEPIFTRGALPSEQSRFARIDQDFRSIMSSCGQDSRITSIVNYPGIKTILATLADQLDRCQKALNEFLEMKRAKFARFYFLGDEDLLEILGQAKKPEVIQSHLKKLFAGVHSVKFDSNCSHVIAMSSIQGEVVTLKNPVEITDEVETWLQKFSLEMVSTLQALLKECLGAADQLKYPTQIVGLSEYLRFTEKTEKSIKSGDFTEQLQKLKEQLEKYTSFDIHAIHDKIEQNLTELKLKSLILDVIHFISVVETLQQEGVRFADNWSWKQQLRFYLSKENKCIIRMHDAEFNYTYEYQGIPPKLVHTPLTDKCYLTMTQAMANGFGGNPFGPAGTGKTESIKALGVLFGRQVLVFNCDEGIDYKSMGRLFVGIVKCGAWGCFDEFNRLEEAVLSAVSQQIQVIQAALKKREPLVTLLSKSIDLDVNSGIFVTLNPAGKGYGGRQRLPDNLKQLFRSVAMTHPDLELISEVILLSEGFKEGKVLGRKVVSIFSLAKQFLTPQQHYDWGLRPLKAVLNLAGNLMHDELKTPKKGLNEAMLIVKALTASVISKLTFNDSLRFNMLVKDIFPNVQLQDIAYDKLREAVKLAYKELNMIYLESQAEKIFQLFEASRQRMGVVLVGPSGSGKSTIWKLYSKAWAILGQKLIIYKSNPKAVDRKILLGHMDMDTREWTDGILTFASRQAVKEPLDSHSWIICDGDVDPEWVESLNSVLDDNRLLTMPNGERIQFGPNINFIFETHDLSFASPATVSRMGMIYLSDETLDSSILIEGWLKKRPESVRSKLKLWIDESLLQCIENIRKNYSLVVETTKAGLLLNALSQAQNCEDKLSYLFALIRGLGSNLQQEHKLKFANEVLEVGKECSPDPRKTLDYFVGPNGKLELYQRTDPEGVKMDNMLDLDQMPVVETPDLKKNLDVILPWLKQGSPLLVVGPEGAGKYTTLRHGFSKLKNTTIAIVHCSAQTKSGQILQRLRQSCIITTTTQGRVLKPKDTERLVLYLKDINLPVPDKYATVELIQFLQQLLTYNGYFDSSLEWISIENIQIVASMNPSSTMGRYKLSTRFTSVVRICSFSYTDREQLQSIYRIFLHPVIETCLPGHPVWSLPKNVLKLANTITSIYEQANQKFTVDVRPHYIFNPRDLTRMIMSLSQYFYQGKDEKELLEIVWNESERVFGDRIVGKDGKQKFQSILLSCLRADWTFNSNMFGSIYTSIASSSAGFCRAPLDEFRTAIKTKLTIYEREVQELDLQVFPELLEQISRIERVLYQPGGSLLLAGRPGIQYHQLVSFTTSMLGFKMVSPKSSSAYSLKSFQNDLKQVIQLAAIEKTHSVFMFEDFQMTNPLFLEIVNSLLSGSEVGSIYSNEDLDAAVNQVQSDYSQEGFRGSTYDYFLHRLRKYLHIVVIFDAASPEFIPRCESNPALYTRCQMIWNDTWSLDSMQQLAKDHFSTSSLSKISDQDKIAEDLMAIHQSCIANGATPKSFMEFLHLYGIIYEKKLDLMRKKQNYLSGGLKKLSEAALFVDKLSIGAKEQQIELAKKQKEADTALKQITESMVTASEQKKEMEALTEQLTEEELRLVARKEAVEKELAEVEPVIRSAKSAVGEIRSESLSEIRSLRAPPPAIRDVLEAVLRLMGNLDMSWNSMKSFLGQRTIKEEIMNFDVRSISKATREAVAEIIRQKENSFEDAVIRRASVAAAPLAMWVKANILYAEVVEKIAPLEKDLKKLTDSLDESKSRVAKLKAALDSVDQKVSDLRDEFGLKTREAEGLRIGLEKAMEIMGRAQGLLEKLSGEGQRWELQTKEIDEYLSSLSKNALLSAAFVTYLGGASEDLRQECVSNWKGITKQIPEFKLLAIMSSESENLVWKSQGLPSDVLSNENAIIVMNNTTTSLLIDPSGQSTEWLKVVLKDKKPEVINQADEHFLRSLELAVRFGKTLIVQEMNDIDSILFPLLRKTLTKLGPRYMTELGDKTIDYNENFRLYLVTKNSNFVLPTNAIGYINIINFTITKAGLAGQLLGMTLKHERPQLEVQKIELLKREEDFKIKLSELEEQLLSELANSEGNILENKSLINSLNEAKEKSTTVAASLSESKSIQATLDFEREKYNPVSKFASVLYFVIHDLQKLNNMYQFSLATFLTLFEKALASGINESDIESRNRGITAELEKLTVHHISRSIFKSDRNTFIMYMIHALHPSIFEENEWELFMGRTILSKNSDRSEREIPKWLPPERKNSFNRFCDALPRLADQINFSDIESWRKWISDSSCEYNIPRDRLSPFQKVLIVQAFRPDRLLTALNNFCSLILNFDSTSTASLSLSNFHDSETDALHPILFITTPGADPSNELREYGTTAIGADKYKEIAMGQGQGDIAIQTIREASSSGGWVCLQNIHLVIGWVKQLEKELSALTPNPKFRLWLTSEAHLKFPPSLLAKCIKVTVEAPPGIQKNLKIIYDTWTPDYISQGSVLRAQALFSLAWFHAVIQERRNYIPQGWNKFYEFSAADLRSGAELLTKLLSSADTIQWEIVHGILMNAVYGGRIDDHEDYLKLKTYLLQYFNNDVFSQEGRVPMKKICRAFNLPRSCDIEAFRLLITEMPANDNVTLFGFPANIDRTYQHNTSLDILAKLQMMEFDNAASKKYNKEEWSQQILPIIQLWKKIFGTGDVLQKEVVAKVDSDPLHSFFEMELIGAMQLISKMNDDVGEMSKLIRGNCLLTNYTLAMGVSFMKEETPKAWLNVWEGPEKLDLYLEKAMRNAIAILEAKDRSVVPDAFLKTPLLLDIFFHPITFLNTLRQQTSRKLKRPMDSLVLETSWSSLGVSSPVKVSIDGIMIQGCRFDGSTLTEANSNDQIFVKVPKFEMAWVPTESVSSNGRIKIPLYTNPSREVLVTHFIAPLQGSPSPWILAGVAFFLTD